MKDSWSVALHHSASIIFCFMGFCGLWPQFLIPQFSWSLQFVFLDFCNLFYLPTACSPATLYVDDYLTSVARKSKVQLGTACSEGDTGLDCHAIKLLYQQMQQCPCMHTQIEWLLVLCKGREGRGLRKQETHPNPPYRPFLAFVHVPPLFNIPCPTSVFLVIWKGKSCFWKDKQAWVSWCLPEIWMFLCIFWGCVCVCFVTLFIWRPWHPRLKLSSVTQSLCYSCPALHPSSKHTHAHTHTHTHTHSGPLPSTHAISSYWLALGAR